MKRIILSVIIFLPLSDLAAQKNKEGMIIFENGVNNVLTSDTIYFYGWDLSHVKLTDGEMIGRTEELSKKMGGILGLLSERFPPKIMEKYLEKPVIADLDVVQKVIQNVNYDNFVSFNSHEITKNNIIQIVQEYELPQKDGIGLVIIGENMNKSERYATAYVTFFDLGSKEPIWVTKMKGLPGSKWGFSKYWYEGFLECLHYFFKRYYN